MRLKAKSGTSEVQFGFKSGRSKIDALKTILNLVKIRNDTNSTPILIDVKNAININDWSGNNEQDTGNKNKSICSYHHEILSEREHYKMIPKIYKCPKRSHMVRSLVRSCITSCDGILRINLGRVDSTVAHSNEFALIVKTNK